MRFFQMVLDMAKIASTPVYGKSLLKKNLQNQKVDFLMSLYAALGI